MKPKWRGRGTPLQGYYVVQNPSKYIGDVSKVIFRSNWERIFMKVCDLSENVVEWHSEPFSIEYVSPIDNKIHKYYPDFYYAHKTKGGIQKYIAEVKPNRDYAKKPELPPGRKTKKRIERFVRDSNTWVINQAKFKFAKEYAESLGMKFVVITEDNIFRKAKSK